MKNLRKLYDTIYDTGTWSNVSIYLPLRTRFLKCVEALRLRSEDIVLDAGCGVGNFLLNLALTRKVRMITGVDISKVAILRAKECQRQLKVKNVEFLVCSIDYLPFRRNVFDKAFSMDVFEHLPQPTKLLTECFVSLKEDGLLFIFTACSGKGTPHYLEAKFTGLLKGRHTNLWPGDDPTHLNRLSPQEMVDMILNIGFTIVKIEYMGHFFSYFRGRILNTITYLLALFLNLILKREATSRLPKARISFKINPLSVFLARVDTLLNMFDFALFGSVPSSGIFMTLSKPKARA